MIAPAQLRAMAQAWRALPERDRSIFASVRLEALDYVAAAERHGCTVDDVEQTIARVLVALDSSAGGPGTLTRIASPGHSPGEVVRPHTC